MLCCWFREFERAVVLQRNPGDGLVLTRGQWSWDIQEASYHQFKGLMQYDNLDCAKFCSCFCICRRSVNSWFLVLIFECLRSYFGNFSFSA